MRYKVLKHNKLEDTYGYLYGETIHSVEILHADIPTLQPTTATITMIKEQRRNNKKLMQQIKDYSMIEVSVVSLT